MSSGPSFEETRRPDPARLRRGGLLAGILVAFSLGFLLVIAVTDLPGVSVFVVVLLTAGAAVGLATLLGARYARQETVVDGDGVSIRRALGRDRTIDHGAIEGVEVVEDLRPTNPGVADRLGRRSFVVQGPPGEPVPGVRIHAGDGEVLVGSTQPDELAAAIEARGAPAEGTDAGSTGGAYPDGHI